MVVGGREDNKVAQSSIKGYRQKVAGSCQAAVAGRQMVNGEGRSAGIARQPAMAGNVLMRRRQAGRWYRQVRHVVVVGSRKRQRQEDRR